jgi:glycosyltransferase involved in cell wall biosynthesis
MHRTNVDVSVIMSVFNGEKYIFEAVNSILRQTFPFFELIIIDDGSTDQTCDILQEINDNRIHTLHNSCNLGLITSLNLGLEIAKGKYIARLDADDIAEPDRLQKQINYLQLNPTIGVLGTNYRLIDRIGNFIDPPVKRLIMAPNMIHWLLFFGCPIAHPTVMVRREVYEKHGYYDPGFPHAEDYELWLRISPVIQIANLPESLVQIRLHSNNISQVHSKEQVHSSVLAAQKALSSFLKIDLNYDIVHGLRNHHYIQSPNQAFEVACQLSDLYLKFMEQWSPSGDEKKEIQADILTRMVELLVFCAKNRSMEIFLVWKSLVKVSPLLVFRSIPKIISRAYLSL